MKTFKMYWAALAIFSLLITSCSKDEANQVDDISENIASLSFSPVLNSVDLNRDHLTPDCSTEDPAYAQIRLLYDSSDLDLIPDTEVIVIVPISEDANGFFTLYDPMLEIPVPMGQTTVAVTLTDFVVWSDIGGEPGNIIWIAPKDGSAYSQFVSTTLDESWNLRAGSKTYFNVDVICFDDREVNLYGYQFFDITPVPLYEFCIFANYCTDEGRHYTADYSLDLYYYDSETEMMGDMIYEDLTPVKGMMDNGTYWADPLCMVIPGAGEGVDGDDPYLYFEATLSDWSPYYTSEDDDEDMISGYLSWNDIEALLNRDGDDSTTNYWHIFFNCDEEDGPSGPAPVQQ